jgi:hypothetical protein
MFRIALLSLLFTTQVVVSEPLLSGEEEPVRYSSIAARSFAVVPDTGVDVGPAFRRMLQTVIAAGLPVEIMLESGKYRIGGGVSHHAAITIEGASHLIIKGAGAATEIILTEPRQGGFFVADSTDVWITDMAVDHDPIPYTQGHIMLVNAEKGWFDFITQEGYPSLAEPWFAEAPKPYGQWGMIFDPKEPRLKSGTADFIFMDSWEQLGARAWRMRPVKEQWGRLEDMQHGDRLVHMARHGKGGAAFFYRSRECGVRNFTVYASQSLAVGMVASDRITVDGMTIERRPGTDRLLTTNSDGVHCQQNLRGPIIENCRFESMADDSVNIYYYPNTITGAISETAIRASRHGVIAKGDVLQLFEPEEGRVLAEVEVAAVEDAPEGEYRITLAMPVQGIKAAPGGHSIYNLSRCGADFVIRNNVFRNHRRHGMMLKAPHGLVEKNTMEGLGGLGIVAGNDPEWPEGVIPYDLTIRNNSIKDVGRSRWYGQDLRGAAIQIVTRASGGRLAAERYFHDVVLENNTVENPPGAAVYIGAARDVAIKQLHVLYRSDAVMPRETAAVLVENAAAVRVEGLHVASEQPGVSAAIMIGETVDAGEAGIILADIDVSGRPGIKTVEDRRISAVTQ